MSKNTFSYHSTMCRDNFKQANYGLSNILSESDQWQISHVIIYIKLRPQKDLMKTQCGQNSVLLTHKFDQS